jgi:hypothetical protein
MPAKSKSDRERPEIPQAAIVAVIVVLVLALGAGGWFAFNGGWQTDAQKDAQAKHEFIPILAAKHGDMEPLEAENRLRKQQGQAPLPVPKERRATSGNNPEKVADLQRRLGAHQGSQPSP